MNKWKKILTTVLAVSMLASVAAIPASAAVIETDQNLVRITNPYGSEGDVDGLVPEGDRETSYAWCMASLGDYVYIGTNKNLGGMVAGNFMQQLLDAGLSEETGWAMSDVVSGGSVPHPTTTEGGQILRVNCLTNEVEVLYTAPMGTSFRIAITHGDHVYFFASVLTGQGNVNEIIRVSDDGTYETVYSAENNTSMRAVCEFDNKLFHGGIDPTEEIAEGYEGSAKLAVMYMDEEDNSVWKRVADYKDFGLQYATDPMMQSPITSPIWDICAYNGDIYATLPTVLGFAVFKGHPAKNGETANEYGWVWEEVVGYNNGVNPIAMNPDASPATGNYISMVATPVVFNDELYLFDFDNTVIAERTAISGVLQQIQGGEIKASDYLRPMYNTLRHPQNLWKLNNETGAFEQVQGFTDMVKDTANEYVWRAEVFEDELYLTTMDSATIYNFLTKLTDGSFLNMSAGELKTQLGYVAKMAASIAVDKSEKLTEIKAKLMEASAELTALVNQIGQNEDVQAFVQKMITAVTKLQTASAQLREELVKCEFVQHLSECIQNVKTMTQAKKDEAVQKVKDYLAKYSLSELIAPGLDVPLSTLSDEELSAYVATLEENLGKFVEKLKVDIPQLRTLTPEDIEAIKEYAGILKLELIDKTIGMELYQSLSETKTAFENRVEYQKNVAKEKVNEKLNELYEKLPEEAQTKISGFVQKYVVELGGALREEYAAKTAEIKEKVAAVKALTLGDYEAIAVNSAEALANHAAEAIKAVNAEFSSRGLGLSDDEINSIVEDIMTQKDTFAANVAADLDKLSTNRELTVKEAVRENIDAKLMKAWQDIDAKANAAYYAAQKIYDSIDFEGLKMYAYINDMVQNDEWGFDMFKTADGENFDVVTRDGFGDKYNYGGRTLVSTPYGLYVGTANPFYGAQLYRLTNGLKAAPTMEEDSITLGDEATVNLNASGGVAPYRYTVLYKKASGTKWVYAAQNTTDSTVSFTPQAAVDYDVRVLTKDAEGNVVKTNLKVNVSTELKNQSRLSADTIKKGDKVKVRAIAKGGTGDYQYAAYYKKASSGKWSVIHEYSENNAFNITPSSAVDYEVRVLVKDSAGNVSEKILPLTVTAE